MSDRLDAMNDESLIRMLVESTLRHYENLARADVERANAASESAMRIRAEISRRGRGAGERLLPLLADELPAVRSLAATFVVDFAPDRARPVLEELADGDYGAISLNAQLFLSHLRGNAK